MLVGYLTFLFLHRRMIVSRRASPCGGLSRGPVITSPVFPLPILGGPRHGRPVVSIRREPLTGEGPTAANGRRPRSVRADPYLLDPRGSSNMARKASQRPGASAGNTMDAMPEVSEQA